MNIKQSLLTPKLTLKNSKNYQNPLVTTLNFSLNSFFENKKNDKVQLTFFFSKYRTLEEINYIIHRAYTTQRYNERQGSANTLTRSEVRGGGRKPWRQKGTGRARAGSNRSPLWKGGGVTFGPKSKLYSNKINRKEWNLAIKSLLFYKEKNIIVIDDQEMNKLSSKTSVIKKHLENLGLQLNQKLVIIIPHEDNLLQKATQNIQTVKLSKVTDINIKEILQAKKLIITKESLNLLEKTYNV